MTIKKKALSGVVALVATAGVAVAVNMASTAEAATYPGPGVVSGATNVHDPSIVKKPDGTYLIAHTGDNIVLKTSTDRTAFKEAGAVFPNGASWTTSLHRRQQEPVGAGHLVPQRQVLAVLLGLDLRLEHVGDLPGHQHHRRVRLAGPTTAW